MTTSIIIAEKPSQATAYASAFHSTREDGYYEVFPNSVFPNGAKITWGIGHLVELKEPHEYDERYKNWDLKTLPIIPSQFEFRVKKEVKKQFDIIKNLFCADNVEIIVGTDSDREGENIARSIINLTGASHKPIKRLWINSLEKDEIIRGFKNLQDGENFIPIYQEAQSRQIGDWLVGLNASRLYTLLLQQKGIKQGFSVGRVQSPSLYLIYKRQKDIENFKPEPYFELEGFFKVNSGEYKGKLKDRFSDKGSLQQALNEKNINLTGETGKVIDVVKTTKKTTPPKLHSLSSLQTLANKKYKYSPSKVLKIVQSLYDSPLTLVTYPRTDTHYITTNEFSYLQKNFEGYKKVAGKEFEAKSLEPNGRYVNNSKVQEHYAIIPTKKIPTEETLNKLSQEQKDIYFEILHSVLAMFHHDYVYEETEILTDVKGLIFNTKGTVVKNRGWKDLFRSDDKEKESLLPNVEKGNSCEAKLEVKEDKTKPPKPFTEGQLINVMKYCGKYDDGLDESDTEILKEIEGLGTEATRSGIIETLKKQNYIEVKKNIVHVTKKGEILCQSIEGTLLAKPEMTAKWESYLKKIGKREGNQKTFISNVTMFVDKLVKETTADSLKVDSKIQEIEDEKHICKCPTCNKGYIIEHDKFYGCTEYKNGCKQSFNKKILNKRLTRKQIEDLCVKKKTSKIKGFKGKKEFDAYLVLKDGKIEFSFK